MLTIAVLTLVVLGAQLLVLWQQARIMSVQTGIQKAQQELSQAQLDWRRTEALSAFYRIAFDLVDEFKKANVRVAVGMPVDSRTQPRLMIREAGRLLAPLGHDVVKAAMETSMQLDQYFAAVQEYQSRPTGPDGVVNWTSVQKWREQVGKRLDLTNSLIPDGVRWTYDGGAQYDFCTLCSLPPHFPGNPATTIDVQVSVPG